MGLEFSKPPPPPPQKKRTRAKGWLVHDERTVANTLANRSDTTVAKHVALARLADRLGGMTKSRRQRVIEQLRISEEVLKEVRKYATGNSWEELDSWNESSSDGSDEGKRRKERKVSFARFAEMRLFKE